MQVSILLYISYCARSRTRQVIFCVDSPLLSSITFSFMHFWLKTHMLLSACLQWWIQGGDKRMLLPPANSIYAREKYRQLLAHLIYLLVIWTSIGLY